MILEKDYLLAVNSIKSVLIKKGISHNEAQKIAYKINQLVEDALKERN